MKIKKSETKDKYLELFRGLKNFEHEGDSITSCNLLTWNDPQRLGLGAGGVGNRRTS